MPKICSIKINIVQHPWGNMPKFYRNASTATNFRNIKIRMKINSLKNLENLLFWEGSIHLNIARDEIERRDGHASETAAEASTEAKRSRKPVNTFPISFSVQSERESQRLSSKWRIRGSCGLERSKRSRGN